MISIAVRARRAREDAAVREVAVPAGSLVADALVRTHDADAFELLLPPGAPDDLDALVRLLMASAPPWVDALMQVRDAAVSIVGLKTSKKLRSEMPREERSLRPGDRAGVFLVYDRGDDEILMGGDDRHLDFRVSLLRRREGGETSAVVTTVVHFNNWLGRAYFLPVRPVHRRIIPALLRRVHARLAAAG